jgi:hypothetical protein
VSGRAYQDGKELSAMQLQQTAATSMAPDLRQSHRLSFTGCFVKTLFLFRGCQSRNSTALLISEALTGNHDFQTRFRKLEFLQQKLTSVSTFNWKLLSPIIALRIQPTQ